MSEFQHKAGTFSLFKNDKDGVENRPDYRGEGKDLQGNDIEVAAWLKQGKSAKFMSCSIKLHKKAVSEIDKDIPF